jgi:predicted O-methyltransferase YrrM
MDINKLITLEENYFHQFDNTSLPRGGLTHEDVHELYNLIKENKQTNIKIADIGCWTGLSTAVFANIAEEYKGEVCAIDWFQGSEATNLDWAGKYYNIKKIFEDNLQSLDLLKRIKIINLPSDLAVQQFPDEYFDVVFLDADHRYKWIKEDINRWLPKVKKGGLLCGHDCEVVINNGIDNLMQIYGSKDIIEVIHLGVCKAVGELGGQKVKDIDKFQSQETLSSSIWYYKK